MMRIAACLCLLILMSSAPGLEQPPWETGQIYPNWHRIQPQKTVTYAYQKNWSAAQNGDVLRQRIDGLAPGEALVIEAGRYEINTLWQLDLEGTADRPIWIMAQKGAQVVLTRKDNKQNVLNLSRGRYLCLKNLEFTGGSSLLRLYDCEQVWIDRCRFYDGGNVAITANTANTSHLHITRNYIRNPGAPGSTSEGMYLGANEGKVVMHSSVIAFNEVHECRGTQGDGIEVKQGSYNNWIVGNKIYDCDYPCLTIYGSQGRAPNIVESNICFRSKNHCMQIQGDAIVRNNIAISAGGAAFYTRDHQGVVNKLQVYHNTFVNAGNAAELRNWSQKESMIFVNNACYSTEGSAIKIVGDAQGAMIGRNVYFGALENVDADNVQSKNGLKDFVNLSVDAQQRDARPAKGSALLGTADKGVSLAFDFYRLQRDKKPSVGAVRPRKTDIRRLQARAYKIKVNTKRMSPYSDVTWRSEEPGPAWEILGHTYKEKQLLIWWPPQHDAQ